MIEEFEGMLTDGIWLRLIIEDVIIETRDGLKDLTAQDVAMEVLGRGNVPGTTSPDALLNACDCYLQLYDNPVADVG